MNPRLRNGIIAALAVLIILAGLFYFIPSWRSALLSLFGHSPSSAVSGPLQFSLYENGVQKWYALIGNKVIPAGAPLNVVAGIAKFPNGDMLHITKNGLESTASSTKKTSSIVLIQRTGLTPDSSLVSYDGTHAVLFNQTTNAFDVFSIAYQGAQVSYIASLPMPKLPTYFSSVGIIPPSTLVIRTGKPDSFELYRIDASALTHTGSAMLSASPSSK